MTTSKNIPFFIYTNSEYFDVTYPCIQRIKKYFPSNKLYIASNEHHKMFDQPNIVCLNYDNSSIYSNRLYETLKKIYENYIIYLHEDMIIYSNPDEQEIEKILYVMELNNIDFVRFCINDGVGEEAINKTNLRFYHGNYYFSVQPTIWKTNKLLSFMEKENKNIWDLELFAQENCKKNFNGYTYCNLNEKQRGLGHKDSIIFPYIATGVVKGKWNIKEYKKELLNIFSEYNIDYTIRGTNEN